MSLDQSVKSVKELVKEFTPLSAIADKINASRNERDDYIKEKTKSSASAVWPTMPTNYGWVCTKCGRSNAPHVNSCSCFNQPYMPVVQPIPKPDNPWQNPTWQGPLYDPNRVTCTNVTASSKTDS